MNLLIDSHVLLWWTEKDRRLSRRILRLLDHDTGPFLISAVTTWELAIKASAGRLNLRSYRFVVEWFNELLEDDRFQTLPVNAAHALAVETLPCLHHDPFDRLLIAQAKMEGIPIITRDRAIRRYDIQTLW